MALKSCRECKKKVSTEAATCPNCGVPNPTSKTTKKKTSEPTFTYKFGKVEVDKEKVVRDTVSPKQTGFSAFIEGEIDLATAFWGYGMLGSIVVGLIFGFLFASVHPGFMIGYIVFMCLIIMGIWKSASSYKKKMEKKNQPTFWGVAAQAVAIISAVGVINLFKDFLINY